MSLKWLCTNASPPFVTTRTQSALQLQTSGAPPTFNSQPQHHDSETSLPITFGASHPTIGLRKSSFCLLWRPPPKFQALCRGTDLYHLPKTFLIAPRSARRRTAPAGTRRLYVRNAIHSKATSNILQLYSTSSSSGTAQPNAITPASTSSPTNASPRPKTSSNSTENGPSTASSGCKNPSQSSSHSLISSPTRMAYRKSPRAYPLHTRCENTTSSSHTLAWPVGSSA